MDGVELKCFQYWNIRSACYWFHSCLGGNQFPTFLGPDFFAKICGSPYFFVWHSYLAHGNVSGSFLASEHCRVSSCAFRWSCLHRVQLHANYVNTQASRDNERDPLSTARRPDKNGSEKWDSCCVIDPCARNWSAHAGRAERNFSKIRCASGFRPTGERTIKIYNKGINRFDTAAQKNGIKKKGRLKWHVVIRTKNSWGECAGRKQKCMRKQKSGTFITPRRQHGRNLQRSME